MKYHDHVYTLHFAALCAVLTDSATVFYGSQEAKLGSKLKLKRDEFGRKFSASKVKFQVSELTKLVVTNTELLTSSHLISISGLFGS